MGVTTALLDICVPSGIFCYRNYKKTENGELGRAPVFVFQGAKVFAALGKAVNQYDNAFAKTATETAAEWSKYSRNYKAVDYINKGVKWGMSNINPLICAASAYKMVTSDDKLHTGIVEVGSLSGMFAGEGWMKENLGNFINEQSVTKLAQTAEQKGLGNISKYILKSGNAGKIASILKGVIFVTGSIASSTLGAELGKFTADKMCPTTEKNKSINFRC